MDQNLETLSAQKDSVDFTTDATEAGKDGTNTEPKRPMVPDSTNRPDGDNTNDTLAQLAKQNVEPFLVKYRRRQYAPLSSEDGTPEMSPAVNTGYCYRHQPDSKCRRQADEQSMRQLQRVSSSPICYARRLLYVDAFHSQGVRHNISMGCRRS